jgi:hypothetical protein
MRRIVAMLVMLVMPAGTRLWSAAGWAEPAECARVVGAYFSQPPVLDGDLSDPCWQQAEAITDLKEVNAGGAPKEPTTFRLGHDDRYLYWSVYAKDAQPGQIRADQKKRGGNLGNDDWAILVLDTYQSHQEMYNFQFNACGTQSEEIPAGAADKTEWRGDWEVATRIVSDGWVGEARIPFSILRYPPGASGFCIIVARNVTRLQETYAWPYAAVNNSEKLAVWSPLKLPRPRPRITTMVHAVPEWRQGSTQLNVGFDSKLVMPSGMEGALSVNPDFEDVAQEVQGIDFTYTERHLDDARPFFVEGRGFYPDDEVFYSRRLEEMEVGVKYFGRMGSQRLGVLDAWDPGNRHTMVGNWTRDFTSRSHVSAVAVVDDNDGQTTTQLGAGASLGKAVGGKGGKSVNLDAYTTTLPDAEGSRQRWSAGTWYGSPGGHMNIWGGYSHSDEGFAPSTGFFPESGLKGWNVGFSRNDDYRTGRLTGHYFGGGLSWRDNLDGSTYDHSVWAWGNVWWRTHRGVGFNYSADDRPPYPNDHTEGVSLWWKTDDIYRKGSASATVGVRTGADYRYADVSQGFRLSERLALQGSASWLRLAAPTWHYSDRQVVLTATYDLDPEHGLSARLVDNSAGSNVYLSYRQKVRKGMDLYVIVGDPNAAETTDRVATKAVWAF